MMNDNAIFIIIKHTKNDENKSSKSKFDDSAMVYV